MVNKCFLIGRVGKDPEFRVTAGGTPMAKFTLATTERHKGKDGQSKEETSWHRLTAWGRSAEVIRDYVHKGDLLYIEGRIHYDSYENKEGQKVYTTDIIVNTFQMLSGKGERQADTPAPAQKQPDQPAGGSGGGGGFEDDDLPF